MKTCCTCFSFTFAAVKLLSVILSMYVLLLTCLPCGDAKDCTETVKTDVAQTDHDDHEDTESCSPFCVCACCGTNMSFDFNYGVAVSDLLQPVLTQKVKNNRYNNNFVSGFYGNIWQPPRA